MVQNSPTPFDVGRAFVHQYYTLLHQAPHMLHRFYSTDSTFIHGGVDRPGCVEQPAVGPENISQRINDLNLRDCHAKIRQVDSHPTIGDGVVVQVTGELSNNGDPMRRFMQTFVLAPRQPKKYYVQNDIFRYQDEVFDDGSDEVDEDDRSGSHIYGDTISNADKTSNADSSVAPVQQPLLVTANARPSVEDHQPLPPRGASSTHGSNQQQQQQNTPNQANVRQPEHQHVGSTNLNGFSNAGETNNYGGLGHTHTQPQQQETTQPSPHSLNNQVTQETQQPTNGTSDSNQQQVKQAQPTSTTEGKKVEGKSYAGIAKLHQPAGAPTNVNASVTPTVRSVANPPSVPLSNSQQPNTIRPQTKAQPATNNRPASGAQPGQRQYPQQRGTNVATAPNEQQVFVGSLPLDFTEKTLIECFSEYGNVIDAKIYTPLHDNKKNFGFVVFDNPESAAALVTKEHIIYNGTIRLNVEPKTQRNYPSNNNNTGSNVNNTAQGGNRNSNYSGRGGARGGNRTSYRGGGNSSRRGGGQFNNNSSSFTASDENNNDYRISKSQPQQQPI